MKNGKKSLESDGIPAEPLKGSGAMIDWLHGLFSVAWNEGRVPDGWYKATICKIYKKGDRNECKDFRGIILLTHR